MARRSTAKILYRLSYDWEETGPRTQDWVQTNLMGGLVGKNPATSPVSGIVFNYRRALHTLSLALPPAGSIYDVNSEYEVQGRCMKRKCFVGTSRQGRQDDGIESDEGLRVLCPVPELTKLIILTRIHR